MTSYTILTDTSGKPVGTVEVRKVVVAGKTVLEKTYTLHESTSSTLSPTPSPPRGRISKWTLEQATSIKAQHMANGGRFDSKQLAAHYHCSYQTIDNLISGKTKQFKK